MSTTDQRRIRETVMTAITSQVYPAYRRFGTYVSTTYIPHGRTEPGVWAITDGEAYYAFLIRQSTTMNKSADEIHQIGLAEVARDEVEMLAIARKLGYSDLRSFNTAVKANPKLHPTSRQQLIDAYELYINNMKAKLPDLFSVLPKASLEVLPVPLNTWRSSNPRLITRRARLTANVRGRFFVNTYNFPDRGLEGVEAIAYHEGLPGHHLQNSIAQEQTELPTFRQQGNYTAYGEGWGLYSERLGKDVGFYQDPYSDYGRLEGDIWRAIRLVVDTGVHSKRWTRQQMVDYFHDHSSVDETNIQSEVDRYIAWPGQALGYKMGQLKLIELCERSRESARSKSSTFANSTTSSSIPVRFHLMCSRYRAWTNGSQHKNRVATELIKTNGDRFSPGAFAGSAIFLQKPFDVEAEFDGERLEDAVLLCGRKEKFDFSWIHVRLSNATAPKVDEPIFGTVPARKL